MTGKGDKELKELKSRSEILHYEIESLYHGAQESIDIFNERNNKVNEQNKIIYKIRKIEDR